MFKNLQNVVELCLHLDENCRKQRVEKKKPREFWGLHFLLEACNLWLMNGRHKGEKYHGALTFLHHRNWCYFEGDKILIYYIAGSCPLFIWGRGVCACWGGVRGYRVWGPPYHRFPEFRFSLPWHSNFLLIMDTTRQEMFNLNLKWGLL